MDRIFCCVLVLSKVCILLLLLNNWVSWEIVLMWLVLFVVVNIMSSFIGLLFLVWKVMFLVMMVKVRESLLVFFFGCVCGMVMFGLIM